MSCLTNCLHGAYLHVVSFLLRPETSSEESLERSPEEAASAVVETQPGKITMDVDEFSAHGTELQAQRETTDILQKRISEPNDAEARRDEIKEHVTQLEAQLEACKQRGRETEDLLQRRTKELNDAEAYLTLIDDVSPREVVQIIEHINGQIFQSASIISKAPEFSFDGPLHATDTGAARTRLEQVLGSDLLASLNRGSSSQSSALVKTALRAGMADYARPLGSSWDVSAVNSPSPIGDAYLKLREKGVCPINVPGSPTLSRWQSPRLWLAGGGSSVVRTLGATMIKSGVRHLMTSVM